MRNDLFWAIVVAAFIAFVLVAGPLVNPRELPVVWDGETPTCPAGYQPVAEETAARAGLDTTYCQRDK